MSAPCQSECDCGAPGGYPHEPDCNSHRECDEGRYCDKHLEEAQQEYAWMAHAGRPFQTKQQDDQDLIDAGRGHLVRP